MYFRAVFGEPHIFPNFADGYTRYREISPKAFVGRRISETCPLAANDPVLPAVVFFTIIFFNRKAAYQQRKNRTKKETARYVAYRFLRCHPFGAIPIPGCPEL
jgi:hypothetical protein